MERKFISADELFAEWRKDPAFVAEYDALEEQFARASAFIGARAHAGMTQEEAAAAMGVTKATVVRLEGGESLPSMKTLRLFAEATNTKLRFSFEPQKPKRSRII